ncbi:uracil-DNA glycosylase family protein [uncultured Alistipes sp.]|uniref:uracil-DNA glycosylase family protein n=1 Tax=uncultured Alistipes sp. TaxID=538949 RepID=UPI00265E7D5E|nr:uracil-DNA glycosylase family protein [uncultured Alistipes sp.]
MRKTIISQSEEQASASVVERHPLEPFLPENARLLMLGSFPPPRRRWSMEFFYPNLQNDMWRIFGYLFFGERNHFLTPDGKAFDRERLEEFLRRKGVALYDTACEVIRLKGNASDNFLQVVRETDVAAMLRQLPQCRAIVTTGQKAAETLCRKLGVAAVPEVGGSQPFTLDGRQLRLWRMPSSSRAYPRPLEWKAACYARMFDEVFQ